MVNLETSVPEILQSNSLIDQKKPGSPEILKPEHLKAGLTLERDDHTITLKFREEVAAIFTHQAEKETIIQEADKILEDRIRL